MDHAGDRAANPTDGKSGRTADFNYHIARAVELFEKHRFSGIAISEVAERLEISQAHLTRVFTTHLGVPPGRYFQRLRMESAASMLLNTNKSVKEIAWEFGYPNQVHFTRTFASVAGIAPREFRTRYYRESPTNYAAKVIPDARPSGDYPTQ
jgi:transcriptional regulator GlxA family with amidase domain